MSSGTAFQTGSDTSVGSETNFETGVVVMKSPQVFMIQITIKLLLHMEISGNSAGAGTAVVGTVSGTSISFGTPAVFETSETDSYFNYIRYYK